MSLKQYYQELKQHDWYYEMSDDNRKYFDAKYNHRRLQEIAKIGGDKFKALFDQFEKHFFSGPAFKTEVQPLPEVPNE